MKENEDLWEKGNFESTAEQKSVEFPHAHQKPDPFEPEPMKLRQEIS
jgi:hypothetical protein